MKPVVFIPEPIAPGGLALLKAECRCLAPWESGGQADLKDVYQVEAVIVRLFPMDEQTILQAKRLKVIGKHGVGVDNIDVRAATAAGVPVVYTPTANANAVAEHTLALMLALARQVVPANAAAVAGRFNDRSQFQGVELAGKRLGVIGLGRIGTRVAEMAAMGFQMGVSAYDPYVHQKEYSGPALLENSLEDLMREADFLTLHVALTEDTRHLINDRTLRWVKPECRLINTSRGAVIDESALVRALAVGRLAGAALDVFEEEPLAADHPLARAPNTLLTPHISSSTAESLDRMSRQAAEGVLDVLKGRVPEHVVNAEVFG